MFGVTALSGFGSRSIYTATETDSEAGNWEGSTAGYTFGTGNLTATTVNKAIRVTDTFPGNVTIDVTATVISGLSYYIGFYDASEDSSFDYNSDQSLYSAITNSWFWRGYDGIHYGNSEVDTIASSNGDTYQMNRIGDTFTFYHNGSLAHTFTQKSTAALRIAVSNGNGSGQYTSMSWTA